MQPAGKLSKLGKPQLGQDLNKAQKKHFNHAGLDYVCLWLSSAKSCFFLLKLVFPELNLPLSFLWPLLLFLMSVPVICNTGERCSICFFLKLDYWILGISRCKVSHVKEDMDRKEYNTLKDVCLIVQCFNCFMFTSTNLPSATLQYTSQA